MKKIDLEEHKEEIRDLYFNRKKSLRKIAKEMKVCMGTIRNKMILWGMERRHIIKRKLEKLSKEELRDLYINKEKTIEMIAREKGVSSSTIFKWIKEQNIPTRRFKYIKFNFSGDLKEKAYIRGLAWGDLHTRKHSRQILTELTTTHPAMTDLFYSIFE